MKVYLTVYGLRQINPVRKLKSYPRNSVRNAVSHAMQEHGYVFDKKPRHISLDRLIGSLPGPVIQTALQIVTGYTPGAYSYSIGMKK